MLVNGILLGLAMALAGVILLAVTILPVLFPLPDHSKRVGTDADDPFNGYGLWSADRRRAARGGRRGSQKRAAQSARSVATVVATCASASKPRATLAIGNG
jgi:hypothetical protein